MDFQWIPGKGADPQAIERMKQHFLKPSEPPPEAWFNTDKQKYYAEFVTLQVDQISTDYLTHYLGDTAGGLKNFYRLEIWVEWFHYLLPYLLERIHDNQMLPATITHFFNIYSEEIVEEYPGFRDDVLKTLGQGLMTSPMWEGPDLWPEDDARWGYNYLVWHEEDWLSPMNASMFFCLKYLTPAEVPSWVASMAAIEGKMWQSELSRWLKGVKLFFDYVAHPEKLPEPSDYDKLELDPFNYRLRSAGIDWMHSWSVFDSLHSSTNIANYFPDENMTAFWREIDKYPQLSSEE